MFEVCLKPARHRYRRLQHVADSVTFTDDIGEICVSFRRLKGHFCGSLRVYWGVGEVCRRVGVLVAEGTVGFCLVCWWCARGVCGLWLGVLVGILRGFSSGLPGSYKGSQQRPERGQK